jgi:hypothetical protein
MSNSETLIAALKYRDGVLIGADSQSSDPPPPGLVQVGVRWETTKLRQIQRLPIVTGFSGSAGTGERILDALCGRTYHPPNLADGASVRKALEKTLIPEFHAAAQRVFLPPGGGIAAWGLSAIWAGGKPLILEHEWNGDSHWHNYFHAIGSGKQTAYAVYHTLGRTRLCELGSDKAVMALMRILITTINIDSYGVAQPIHVWNVTAAGAVELGQVEIDHHAQAVEKWIKQEQDAFIGPAEAVAGKPRAGVSEPGGESGVA